MVTQGFRYPDSPQNGQVTAELIKGPEKSEAGRMVSCHEIQGRKCINAVGDSPGEPEVTLQGLLAGPLPRCKPQGYHLPTRLQEASGNWARIEEGGRWALGFWHTQLSVGKTDPSAP